MIFIGFDKNRCWNNLWLKGRKTKVSRDIVLEKLTNVKVYCIIIIVKCYLY